MHRKTHKGLLLATTLGLWGLSGTTAAPAHAKASSATDAKQEAKKHFQQGISYQSAGDYPHAVEEFEAAYKLFPSPAMLFNLGQAYRLKGDRKPAIDYYQRYLKEVPSGSASAEASEHLQKLTEEQAAEDREKEKSQLVIVPPPSPPSSPHPALDLTKTTPTHVDTNRKRLRWGLIGGGIGAAVAGGVIAGVLVGTANQVPRPDGVVTVP